MIGATVVYQVSKPLLNSVMIYAVGHRRGAIIMMLSERGLLKGQKIGKLELCEHCIFGSQYWIKFTTGNHLTKQLVEYIRSSFERRCPIYVDI